MSYRSGLIAGLTGALLMRAVLIRVLLIKLRRDVARINEGDYGPLLAGYAEDAVLLFNDGPHRWAGEHRGRARIERFLKDFTAAGIQGEIRALWIGGPPWAMTLIVRFDDSAERPDGERIYANRTVLLARTRWGRIVEQEDFYEDTGRILALEERLRELGVEPAAG
jgi:ketosteroid isomerase-like protein